MMSALSSGAQRRAAIDAAVLAAWSTTPSADGLCAWYAAVGQRAGCTVVTSRRSHRRQGLAPRVAYPTACRWCGAGLKAEWARRVASRLCRDCCGEAGRAG